MLMRNDELQPPLDAMAMLQADHQKVKDLFSRYQLAQDQEAKRQMADQVLRELDVHAQLEEHVFYPAFEQGTNREGAALVEASLHDHGVVANQIQELRAMSADDAGFEAKFRELRKRVEQHMYEAEGKMFPQAAQELAKQVEDVADEMRVLKDQLLAS